MKPTNQCDFLNKLGVATLGITEQWLLPNRLSASILALNEQKTKVTGLVKGQMNY